MTQVVPKDHRTPPARAFLDRFNQKKDELFYTLSLVMIRGLPGQRCWDVTESVRNRVHDAWYKLYPKSTERHLHVLFLTALTERKTSSFPHRHRGYGDSVHQRLNKTKLGIENLGSKLIKITNDRILCRTFEEVRSAIPKVLETRWFCTKIK